MWPFSEMSLSTASLIGTIANWGLLASLVTGLLSTFVIVKTTDVKEEHWAEDRKKSNERIVVLGTQGDQARADLGAAQAEIAKSRLLIAEADARAALANEKAEALRKESIAVWEAVSPRSVEFLNSVADLKKLAGTKYLVVSFSEYEMRFTAAQIRSVLKHAGWQRLTDPSPELSKLPPGQIMGIDIERSADMADAQPWEAATALASQLSKSGISASSMGSFRVNRDLPQNSIRVIVGMKPINTPPTALLAKPGLTVTGSTDGDDWEQ